MQLHISRPYRYTPRRTVVTSPTIWPHTPPYRSASTQAPPTSPCAHLDFPTSCSTTDYSDDCRRQTRPCSTTNALAPSDSLRRLYSLMPAMDQPIQPTAAWIVDPTVPRATSPAMMTTRRTALQRTAHLQFHVNLLSVQRRCRPCSAMSRLPQPQLGQGLWHASNLPTCVQGAPPTSSTATRHRSISTASTTTISKPLPQRRVVGLLRHRVNVLYGQSAIRNEEL